MIMDEADITPTPSVPLQRPGKAISDWKRWVYSDEVFWRYRTDRQEDSRYYNVATFPFVPGYFLCKVLADDDENETECHFPVVGPFPTLKAAMTASMTLGPQEDFEG